MTEYIYKTIGDTQLKLKAYFPEKWAGTDKRSAIVFYFGGGWAGGKIDQFKPQSQHLAKMGMVAITPEYRVKSRHNTTPFDCVQDAKDALKWIYDHSEQLGIDRERIITGGGSAGGHLAACTAILRDPNIDPDGAWKIPKAMVLFNPVTDTTETGFGRGIIGENSKDLSPVHHICKGIPPAIVFHGTADTIVPFQNSVDFCKKMLGNGNLCELVPYEGQKHGFFNPIEGREEYFNDTIIKVERYLRKHGYIESCE